MTNKLPKIAKRAKPAKRIDRLPSFMAPPNAPLVMPKQVIQPTDGFVRRAAVQLVARLTLLRHSVRRSG